MEGEHFRRVNRCGVCAPLMRSARIPSAAPSSHRQIVHERLRLGSGEDVSGPRRRPPEGGGYFVKIAFERVRILHRISSRPPRARHAPEGIRGSSTC
jgi:hypothetical protein